MPKVPTPTIIYLAGPMDDVPFAEADGWRSKIAAGYPDVLFYMPNRAYINASKFNASIVRHMNNHAIKCSHGLLANLTGPGRGFGTIREIEYSRSTGGHVAVACNDGDINDRQLMTFDLYLHPTVDEAMADLMLKITDSRHEQDPNQILGMMLGRLAPPDDEDE